MKDTIQTETEQTETEVPGIMTRYRDRRRTESNFEEDDELETTPERIRTNRPGWRQRLVSASPYDESETTVALVKIDPGKRFVAAIVDIIAAYIVALIVSMIPFVKTFFDQFLTIALFLTVRDFLFQGRGIGKNMMGLQVVDIKTGQPISLPQTIKRNGIIFAPVIVLKIVSVILHILPIPFVSSAIGNVIELAGTVYLTIVIPYEAYRVYARTDGRRWGDQFAGTTIVESRMDFSNPVN